LLIGGVDHVRGTTARHWNATFRFIVTVATCLQTVHAGPPYVTDDPEPTETHQFENYLYVQATHAVSSSPYPGVGIEINYGAFANTQLSWAIPLNPNPGPGGMGQVWAPLGGGIKYRLIQEDSEGWRPQVAVFPQIFIPIGSASHSTPITELLPIWLQKSFGPWTTFGGGGFTRNPGTTNRNFAVYGWALQRQINDKLEFGVELFGQSHDTAADHGSTAAGIATLYDLDETWHLIGSVNSSIAGARENDEFSYNLALKWTH
jgi:hypothetical protein